eukprot:gene2265-2439_t
MIVRELIYFILLILTVQSFSVIDLSVQNEYKKNTKINIVILFKQDFNYSKLKHTLNSDEKSMIIFKELNRISKKSQNKIKKYLSKNKLKHKTFFSPNCIFVDKIEKKQLLNILSFESENVKLITLNQKIKQNLGKIVTKNITKSINQLKHQSIQKDQIEWNIKRIFADKVWEKGIKGKGIIVANADTGIKWDHPALKNTYNGNKNGKINHNYSWYDALHEPIDEPDNVCGYNLTIPCDDYDKIFNYINLF